MLAIVWDIDDVLNDLMHQWFEYSWLVEHPDCRVQYTGLSANPPHDVLGVPREDYLASLDDFRKTQRAIKMEPNPEVLLWMRRHGRKFRHIALTARPLDSAPDVAHWLMHHFGSWIRCFGVVPSRMTEDVPFYDRDKGEYLRWLGCGNILVDDSPENIVQARSLGMKTLLFPQPWNNSKLTVESLLSQLTEWSEES